MSKRSRGSVDLVPRRAVWTVAVATLLALPACERRSGKADSQADGAGDVSAARGAASSDPEQRAKARQQAQAVLKCLGQVATLETVWTADCFVPHMPLEVVGHVPSIAPQGTRMDAAEVLSFALALDFESPRLHPELLLSDGRKIVVSGRFRARWPSETGRGATAQGPSETARAGPVEIPMAGATLLDDAGRMREARIYFDQRLSAPPRAGSPDTPSLATTRVGPSNTSPSSSAPAMPVAPQAPTIVIAANDAAEAAQLEKLDSALDANRRGDVAALRALYSTQAVLRERGLGADLHGADAIAEQLGAKQHIDVAQRWAAGKYAVLELSRRAAGATAVRSLEIVRFEAGLIAEHVRFHSRYRADISAGVAEPPDARPGAGAIRQSTSVTLLEGLPHQAFEAEHLAAEIKAKRVVRRHRYPFYADPLPLKPEHAQWLTEILADARAMKPFSGEKKCGGFHPDYAIRWQDGAVTYDALVCFGCGELKWVANGKTTRYDMAHWAALNLETALRGYRRSRPSAKKAP